MRKLQIKGIEVVKGKNEIPVEYFIEHFNKQGKDVEILLRYVFGRDSICLADENETSYTMSLQACKAVLASSQVNMKDIDMVIFSGLIPEYAMPQVALMIHEELNGKEDCLCFDINVNCIGMLSAIELASGYFSSASEKKNVLIVGSDDIRVLQNENNPLTYGVYGNIACAIIAEISGESESKLIDTQYSVTHPVDKNIEKNSVLYPDAGFYKVLNPKTSVEAKFQWKQFDSDELYEDGRNRIINLISKNGYCMEDISLFCLSQLSQKHVSVFQEIYEIEEERCPYVSRKIGYCGTASPLLVLYYAIKEEKIKRGDLILLWTIGMGSDDICMLLQY